VKIANGTCSNVRTAVYLGAIPWDARRTKFGAAEDDGLRQVLFAIPTDCAEPAAELPRS
jgi:hypothetical protein